MYKKDLRFPDESGSKRSSHRSSSRRSSHSESDHKDKDKEKDEDEDEKDEKHEKHKKKKDKEKHGDDHTEDESEDPTKKKRSSKTKDGSLKKKSSKKGKEGSESPAAEAASLEPETAPVPQIIVQALEAVPARPDETPQQQGRLSTEDLQYSLNSQKSDSVPDNTSTILSRYGLNEENTDEFGFDKATTLETSYSISTT